MQLRFGFLQAVLDLSQPTREKVLDTSDDVLA